MKLQAVDRQRAVLDRRDRAGGGARPAATNSSDTLRTWSPWLIQTSVSSGRPANRSACEVIGHGPGHIRGPGRCRLCRPAPRRPVAFHSRCRARECPGGKIAGIALRGAVFVNAGRAAREDDAPRGAARRTRSAVMSAARSRNRRAARGLGGRSAARTATRNRGSEFSRRPALLPLRWGMKPQRDSRRLLVSRQWRS